VRGPANSKARSVRMLIGVSRRRQTISLRTPILVVGVISGKKPSAGSDESCALPRGHDSGWRLGQKYARHHIAMDVEVKQAPKPGLSANGNGLVRTSPLSVIGIHRYLTVPTTSRHGLFAGAPGNAGSVLTLPSLCSVKSIPTGSRQGALVARPRYSLSLAYGVISNATPAPGSAPPSNDAPPYVVVP
jgi:hypothetical protein